MLKVWTKSCYKIQRLGKTLFKFYSYFLIKNFWHQIFAYIKAIWPLVLVSYCFCVLPHILHGPCKFEHQKIYIPQWMLTIIEVRIVYKTQQKKKGTSTWIYKRQSRKEKMKRSHGIFKRQSYFKKTYHICIYTMVTNVEIYWCRYL
jgi:hypothetical protein